MKAGFGKKSSPVVLVVDDNPDRLRATVHMLKKAGYQVEQASGGREGLAATRRTRPDLVLLDVMLPDLDGLEVLRLIRSDKILDNMSVVLATESMGENPKLWEGLETGADDFIVRPLASELLLARVKVQLRHRDLTQRLWAQSSGERIKELRTLKEITELLLETDEISESLLTKIPPLLTVGMRFPQWAEAVVSHDQQEASSKGFAEIVGKITSDFQTRDGGKGCLTVGYRKPPGAEVPDFLPEEQEMIGAVANMIRSHFDRILAEKERRRSEDLLSVASRCGKLGGWTVEMPGMRHGWTEETREIHGYEPGVKPAVEELFAQYLGPDQERLRLDFESCLKDGVPFNGEYRFRNARGRMMWVRVIGEAMRGPERAIHGVQGAIQDITESKEVETSLAESDRRFRQLADAMPMIVWTALPDGTVDYSNREFSNYTGVSQKEPPAIRWQACLHPDDLDRCFHTWSECARTGANFEIEYRIRRGFDGAFRWFRVQAVAQRDECGTIRHWYGTAIDIHDSKELQETSSRLADRLTTVLHGVTDGFFILDQNLCITFTNPRAETLLGASRETLIGHSMAEQTTPISSDLFLENYRRALESGQQLNFEAFSRRNRMWLQIRLFPSAEGLAVFAHDITDEIQSRRRLQESEERYRTMVEYQSKSVCRWKPDGTLTFVNKEYCEFFERTADELVGSSWLELVPEDAKESVKSVLINLKKHPRFHVYEHKVLCKKGLDRWQEWIDSPIFDEDGNLIEFQSVGRDITPRRQAEEALRISEERYRLHSKATSEAIWDWDLVNNRVDWSDGFFEMTGLSPNDVNRSDLHSTWTSRIHPEDRERVLQNLEKHWAQGAGRLIDHYRFRKADGSYLYVNEHGYYIRDKNGRVVRGVGGLIDITKWQKVQDRLNLLAATLDAAVDPVVITDRAGMIEWVNKAFSQKTGYTEEEALGKTPEDLLKSGKHPVSFYQKMWSTILSGKTWSAEMINRCKDGTLLSEQVVITPVRDSDSGEILHFVAIKRDLTEDKLKDDLLQRAQRMESIGTLAGGMAHDLNNLLAPILMAADLLKTYPLDTRGVRLLDQIERAANRGAGLIKQVLTFARGTTGERVELPFKQLLEGLRVLVENTFPKNLRISIEVANDLPPVMGDPTQIDQVLVNLAVNARDAMPQGGAFTVRAKAVHLETEEVSGHPEVNPGDFVMIEAVDSGEGMTPEIQAKIFDPFFTTKPQGMGTGLGLSTCLGIVRSHGGFIQLSSEPQVGSVFKIYLPAAKSHSAKGDTSPV